jgi:hypothetical protein
VLAFRLNQREPIWNESLLAADELAADKAAWAEVMMKELLSTTSKLRLSHLELAARLPPSPALDAFISTAPWEDLRGDELGRWVRAVHALGALQVVQRLCQQIAREGCLNPIDAITVGRRSMKLVEYGMLNIAKFLGAMADDEDYDKDEFGALLGPVKAAANERLRMLIGAVPDFRGVVGIQTTQRLLTLMSRPRLLSHEVVAVLEDKVCPILLDGARGYKRRRQ